MSRQLFMVPQPIHAELIRGSEGKRPVPNRLTIFESIPYNSQCTHGYTGLRCPPRGSGLKRFPRHITSPANNEFPRDLVSRSPHGDAPIHR